jgi:hypothetical protein
MVIRDRISELRRVRARDLLVTLERLSALGLKPELVKYDA